MNSLARLLSVEGFSGITDIVLESPCFQLDDNGQVFRHVCMGMTQQELLIATQSLPNCSNLSQEVPSRSDLEIEGLHLKWSIPLKYVRLYVVDDRSRKFAVCSCLGKVQYFELCNTPDSCDSLWAYWLEYFSKQDNPLLFGYKTWYLDNNIGPISKCSLEFIRRPFSFYCVESVGSQTSGQILELVDKPSNVNNTMLSTGIHDNGSFYERYEFFKLPIYLCFDRKGKITGPSTTDDLPNFNYVKFRNAEGCRSKSCSDLSEGLHISSTVSRYSIFGLIYQWYNGDRNKAIDLYSNAFPEWNNIAKISGIYSQILKLQRKEAKMRCSPGYDSNTESDDSITDLVTSYKDVHGKKTSASSRWQRARMLTMKKRELSAFERVVQEAVFEKYLPNRRFSEMSTFIPAEFTTELILMASEIVVKISLSAFHEIYRNHIPRIIGSLLEHFRGISVMVTTDIAEKALSTQRLESMTFYIKAAKLCLSSGDYQSSQAILHGLSSPRVYSLTKEWVLLKETATNEYTVLMQLFNTLFKHENYIQHFKDQYSKNNTRLPLLDHFLHHLWRFRPHENRFQGLHDYNTPSSNVVETYQFPTHERPSALKPKAKTDKAEFVEVSTNHLPMSDQKFQKQISKPHIVPTEKHNVPKTTITNAKGFALQGRIAQDFCDTVMKEAIEIISSNTSTLANETTVESYIHPPETSHTSDDVKISNQTIKKQPKQKKKRGFISRIRTRNKNGAKKLKKSKIPKGEFVRQNNQSESQDRGNTDSKTNIGLEMKKHVKETNIMTQQSHKEDAPVDSRVLKSTTKESSSTEDNDDTKYITTRHRQRPSDARRKSMFEENEEDEVTVKMRQGSIDDAVSQNMKQFRKCSIFDSTYLDEKEDTGESARKSTTTQPTNNRRQSLAESLFSNSTSGQVHSFIESLLFQDEEKSIFSNLFSSNKTTSTTENKNVAYQDSLPKKSKKKKSVTFGDVQKISFSELDPVDKNVNSNSTMKVNDICEYCSGPCIYNEVPYKEILKSQLLAITYINSHSSRLSLRKLINEKLCHEEKKIP